MNSLKSATRKLINKTTGGHMLCWTLLIFYELVTIYYTLGKLEQPYIYLIYYTINICFFYIYVKLLSFTFSSSTIKYFTGIAGYLILFSFFLIAKGTTDYLLGDPRPHTHNRFIYIQGFIPRNIFRGLYFTVLATFYWSAGHISYFRRQTQEAEQQNLIAQKEKAELETILAKSKNAYLQQQINPHMLFNALNFVYSSAQKYSDDAAQCIWLLAEIMRFSLEDTNPDGKIIVEREAEQIENLLAINRYRFNEPLHITVDMEGDFNRFQIIPLILLTLTENIFKHGNLNEADQPAALRLTVDEGGKLVFFSRNLKKTKNEHPRRRQPLGLQNVRIRLDSIYAGNYRLDIAEPGEFYELTLTLNLCA